jgi:perosamine synthetase
MIPRFRPYVTGSELAAALSLPHGSDVEKFEQAFASAMGHKYAIAFPYGRTALVLFLEALGLKNKEIICPAYTCVVVAHAIVMSGNRPVFVDAQRTDCNMDLDGAARMTTEHTGAIFPTSLFGHPVDLDELANFQRTHPHVATLQDCGHSYAAAWHGKPVHQAGTAAMFALNVSKIMTSIFGGMLTTDDGQLANRLRELRAQRLVASGLAKSLSRLAYLIAARVAFTGWMYGLTNRMERAGLLNRFVKYYDDNKIDMPSNWLTEMTPIEARVGMVQLGKYEAMIEARRRYAAYYRERLAGVSGITFPDLPDRSGVTFSQIVGLVKNRPFVMEQARRGGVQLGEVVEYCIPDMPAYRPYVKEGQRWPRAHFFARHVINLPVSGYFEPHIAQRVVDVLTPILADSAPPDVAIAA